MSRYGLNFSTGMVNKNIDKNELKETLRSYCDEDYSGNNGPDYYRKDEKGNPTVSMFDDKWEKVKDLPVIEVIKEILDDNYSTDSYYQEYELSVLNAGEEVVFSFACLTYC